jgi:heptaprenyl diphosphate synthase
VAALSPLQFRPDLDADVERVNRALCDAARAGDDFLSEIAAHLIPARGKRLRPSFVIASALIGTSDPLDPSAVTEDMVQAGASVELVHLGSLYHDDVMDDADVRHGVESVNHRWGNLKAILAGDFLLARASEIAAALGTEIAGLLAATIACLCEGQVGELQYIYDRSRTEASYLTAIEGKTAALYSTSCRIGALVGGLRRPDVDRLTEFGRLYGMAYQVVDDVLDLVATDEELGKPAGHDMREGVYTLPVIRLLSESPDGELAGLLGDVLSDPDRLRARQIVLASHAVGSAIDTAASYSDSAIALLEPLPASPAVEGLRAAAKNLLAILPD